MLVGGHYGATLSFLAKAVNPSIGSVPIPDALDTGLVNRQGMPPYTAMSHELSEPLVTVVIPAYNAEATISETLDSVRGQTHHKLEIIVVDDESTDRTAGLLEEQAAADPRIQIVRQPNGGVASARNKGAELASGEFIAFVDADDLWRPDKIEKQLAAFERRGANCGLVYTMFELIDKDSNITSDSRGLGPEGDVFDELARRNFVGNGSSTLIRTKVFRETDGFDSSLRARGGEGCEDWKLYCEIARRHEFGLVREPLTGYRTLPDNMSSNVRSMVRSRDFVVEDFTRIRPDLSSEFREGRNLMCRYILHRALRERRFSDAAWLALSMARFDLRFLLKTIVELPSKYEQSDVRKSSVGSKRPFLSRERRQYHPRKAASGR